MQGVTELSTGLTSQNDSQNQSSEMQLSPPQITNLGGRDESMGWMEYTELKLPEN